MSKLSKEDLTLWNLYKSNLIKVSKKTEYNIIKDFKYTQKKQNSLLDKAIPQDVSLIKLLKKKKVTIEAYVDLHGMHQLEAKKRVQEFIKKSFYEKTRHVVIITGKGFHNKGILKSETPNWLNENGTSKYVAGYTTMPRSSGGEGAIYVKIKNLNKYRNNDQPDI